VRFQAKFQVSPEAFAHLTIFFQPYFSSTFLPQLRLKKARAGRAFCGERFLNIF
jgi:hypothetical protein